MSTPFVNTASNFRAGNIARFVDKWTRVSGDPWIANTVMGVAIPFWERPLQSAVPFPFKLSQEERGVMDSQIGRLLEKGVVEFASPEEGQFISNVFLRPKANGEYRLILDLTELNKLVLYEHFKMTSLSTVIEMMRPGCWMGSVDLKDAYYSVPMPYECRKYLRFV